MTRPAGHVAAASPRKCVEKLSLLHWKVSSASEFGGRFTFCGKRKVVWDPFHCAEMKAACSHGERRPAGAQGGTVNKKTNFWFFYIENGLLEEVILYNGGCGIV